VYQSKPAQAPSAQGPQTGAAVCGPRLFEDLKNKRLTKRVVQKPDGRYLIYYAPRETR
jgi:hypothetical protein